MYKIILTNKFKHDVAICQRRGLNRKLLDTAIELLSKTGKLPVTYKPHTLSGTYAGFWECHLKADWLFIWIIDEKNKTITLVRTGSHSDLF